MSLWGKLDAANNAPKFLINGANTSIVPAANTARDYNGLPKQLDLNSAFFVDTTEAGVTSNRAAGIHTPGWNLIFNYTDAQGRTRRRVESLVPMKVSAAAAGDLGVSGNTTVEDATVADS
jgi:hypothetical protein